MHENFQLKNTVDSITGNYLYHIYIYIELYIYDGFSKVLFPISAKNRNSLRDAFSFTWKKSYTEDTSKMQ